MSVIGSFLPKMQISGWSAVEALNRLREEQDRSLAELKALLGDLGRGLNECRIHFRKMVLVHARLKMWMQGILWKHKRLPHHIVFDRIIHRNKYLHVGH